MASINSDIRLRSRNTGRLAAVIILVGAVTLSVSFALSFLPSQASAASIGDLYATCHDHIDNDGGDGIDLKASACASVANDIPDVYNETIVTDENTASSTTLTTVDGDNDLLYFEITSQPQHGTLTGLATSAYTVDAPPTVIYTPNAGYTGTDSFDVKVSDGLAGEHDLVGQLATVSIVMNAPVTPVAAACTTAPSSYDVDVTQQVTNDPDSGFFGNWALDAFTRQIQIWANTDSTSTGITYCAKADDTGSFTTTGPQSPNSNVPLTAGITGTMTGSTGIMTIVGTLSAQWPTTGVDPAQDCNVAGTDCEDGLTTKWFNNYFAAGATNDYENWGWTYNACGHGTWTNAAAGSTGDILSAGASCVVSHTASTVVVTPSNMNGWAFINDQTNGAGSGAMVDGPSTAPLGLGSAQLTATSSTDGQILEVAAPSIKFANLTSLSYSTYQDPANPSTATAIALQFNVDKDVTDADNSWQGRMVYEPYNNNGGSVPLGSWSMWDALNSGNGKWWFSSSASKFGGQCGQAAPCTMTQILSLFPNIGIHPTLGAIVLKAGSGWASFSGNVDHLVMGVVDASGNENTTTYDFEPADPTCTSSQTLTNHVCVDNTTSGSTGSSGSNGGGGTIASGPLSIGFVNTNTGGGEVLGTSTEAAGAGDSSASCPLYITGYLKQGMSGDDVAKLQTFLNSSMGANLPVTGTFGPMTLEAVKNFQIANWQQVLAPWTQFGLPSDHTATGYVYKTTQRMINLLECNNAITIPQPQLP